jgi:hypothetical protein
VSLKYLTTGIKYLTTGIAAAALVGAAAASVTSIPSSAPVTAPAISPVVFGAPLPLDQGDISGQLSSVLYGLAQPGGSFHSDKSGLVEGGVGLIEGRAADRALANANQQGMLPLSFQVANVRPAPDGSSATASVTVSGPQLAPRTQDVTFVNNGHWMVSRASAMAVLSAVNS